MFFDRGQRPRLQLRFNSANSSTTCFGRAKAIAKNGITYLRIRCGLVLSRRPMIGLMRAKSKR